MRRPRASSSSSSSFSFSSPARYRSKRELPRRIKADCSQVSLAAVDHRRWAAHKYNAAAVLLGSREVRLDHLLGHETLAVLPRTVCRRPVQGVVEAQPPGMLRGGNVGRSVCVRACVRACVRVCACVRTVDLSASLEASRLSALGSRPSALDSDYQGFALISFRSTHLRCELLQAPAEQNVVFRLVSEQQAELGRRVGRVAKHGLHDLKHRGDSLDEEGRKRRCGG